jgi:S-adenosylmethionine:tRNA ribosyltransferase-isomerase
VLVLNNTKVIPARLRAFNTKTGGQFEILLLEENAKNDWWAMLRPGKRARIGTRIQLKDAARNSAGLEATVIAVNEEGHRRLRFTGEANVLQSLEALGEVPLPPYIDRSTGLRPQDRERYQTVFAAAPGSVAAPTAGLHFTQSFLTEIRNRGVDICFVTLHVGLGTFAPVKTETLAEHQMHEEKLEMTGQTIQTIRNAKRHGNRIIAAGTTVLRALESWGSMSRGQNESFSGKTRIFIFPPYQFKIVDALLTNFHLPRSTLLMLISAFAAPGKTEGRQLVLSAYAEAIRQRYRFFSYGDAMLLV